MWRIGCGSKYVTCLGLTCSLVLTAIIGIAQNCKSALEIIPEQADETRAGCFVDSGKQGYGGSSHPLTKGVSKESGPGFELGSNKFNGEMQLISSQELTNEDDIEFEVEDLVAKGRIGRRVWYKVKWKGYPESDNIWVRKKDIGAGAIADYERKHPHCQGEFGFDQVVSKKDIEGVTLYEVRWQDQPDAENIWVGKSDLTAGIVATFEAGLTG